MPSLYHSWSGTQVAAIGGPEVRPRPVAIFAGIALSFVAVLTVLVAPDRSQVVFTIQSSGANEVIVPLAYWVAVAAWAGLIGHLTGGARALVLAQAIVIGWVLHVLLLLTDFAPRLADPAAFSSPFYRIYSRVFLAAVVVIVVGWATRRRPPSATGEGRVDAIEVPVLTGTLVFVLFLLRSDPWLAGAGVVTGLLAGPAARWLPQVAPGWQAWWQRSFRDERWFLVVVFLGALGLRILYLLRVMTDADYLATGGDGVVYDQLAWSIAQGQGVPESFSHGYPLLLLGYVRFVAAVYAVAGHSYFAICAVQSVLGAATCVLLYAIAKPLFGVPTARLAAAFTAVSFPLLFASAAIGHQAVDVFMMAILIWLLGQAATAKPRLTTWVGIGVMVGCAIAVRETNAFFLVLVVAWTGVVLKRASVPAAGRAAGAVVVGAVAILLPLMAPMVNSPEDRLRLRQHFDRLYTGQGDAVRMRDELATPLSDPGAAMRQLRDQPALVTATLGRSIVHNFAVQFMTQPFGGFDLVFLAKGSRYYYGMWFYAYALTGAGLVLAIRRIAAGDAQAPVLVLILGLIVARTLPHLLLESHYRHRVPIEPFLILLAALAVVTVGQTIRVRPTV